MFIFFSLFFLFNNFIEYCWIHPISLNYFFIFNEGYLIFTDASNIYYLSLFDIKLKTDKFFRMFVIISLQWDTFDLFNTCSLTVTWWYGEKTYSWKSLVIYFTIIPKRYSTLSRPANDDASPGIILLLISIKTNVYFISWLPSRFLPANIY